MDIEDLRRVLSATALGFLLGLPLATSADEPADDGRSTEAVLAFDRLIAFAAPLCRAEPAERCVDLGFQFADDDGDRGISLGELRRVRDALEAWASWRRPRLARDERAGIAFGLALVDAVGLEALLASYDQDNDGRLDRAELLADLRLDERPLGEILLDPAAVDRAAVARRMGRLAPLLDPAFP